MTLGRLAHLSFLTLSLSFALIVQWMAIEFVVEKVSDEPPKHVRAKRTAVPIQFAGIDTPPRFPIGKSVIGNAQDDYQAHALPEERLAFRSLVDASGGLRELSVEEVAYLDDPIVERVVDTFVRGPRREFFGAPTSFARGLDLHHRLKTVRASAVLDLSRGDLDGAWAKAIALTRMPFDAIGRDSIIALAFSLVGESKTVILATAEAVRGEPGKAADWLRDLDIVLLDQLPSYQVAPAILQGESRAVKELDFGPKHEGHIRDYRAFSWDMIAEEVPPRAVKGRCNERFADWESTFCDMLSDVSLRYERFLVDLHETRNSLAAIAGHGADPT